MTDPDTCKSLIQSFEPYSCGRQPDHSPRPHISSLSSDHRVLISLADIAIWTVTRKHFCISSNTRAVNRCFVSSCKVPPDSTSTANGVRIFCTSFQQFLWRCYQALSINVKEGRAWGYRLVVTGQRHCNLSNAGSSKYFSSCTSE